MAAVKLVTRCPACHTAFRLVADQLRLRGGLVRCGHCDNVFDARDHLIELPAGRASQASPLTQATRPEPREPATASLPFDPGYDVPALDAPTMMMDYGADDAERHAEPSANVPAGPAQHPGDTAEPAKSAAEADVSTWPEPLATFVPGSLEDDAGQSGEAQDDRAGTVVAEAPVAAPPSLASPTIPGLLRASADDDFADTESASEHAIERAPVTGSAPRQESRTSVFAPDFLRHGPARDAAAPAARRRRLAWPLAAVLALAAIGAGTFLARTELAGRFPQTRPLLERACVPLRCEVAPWRDIDALRIDTSQLQKQDENTNDYELSVTLRNQGRASVALPAIELVMTDLQDQLLLRRVLQPADYLAPMQRANAGRGLRAGTDLPVRVRFRTRQTAANYRVLIFYP